MNEFSSRKLVTLVALVPIRDRKVIDSKTVHFQEKQMIYQSEQKEHTS